MNAAGGDRKRQGAESSLRQGLGQVPISHRAQRAANTTLTSHTQFLQLLRPSAKGWERGQVRIGVLVSSWTCFWCLSKKGPKARSRKDVPPITDLQLDLGSVCLVLPIPSPLQGDTSSAGRLRWLWERPHCGCKSYLRLNNAFCLSFRRGFFFFPPCKSRPMSPAGFSLCLIFRFPGNAGLGYFPSPSQ